uniref:Uncharacterized protein n=1 Tax=Oryza nivara TaxID=4536 RepID=A0A0E0HIY0_ORYNI
MEAAAVAEMAIVLEDALFCLQCLPLLASDKLTLEHRTSKTRRSRKGFVTGRSGRTNCRYRTREKGPPPSQVFAIMYMAKIVVTGQELLRKLTVSSLGWKTSGRGGRQEALIFSDTCYSFHLKCRNPVHKSKSFDQDRRLDEPLNAMKKIA